MSDSQKLKEILEGGEIIEINEISDYLGIYIRKGNKLYRLSCYITPNQYFRKVLTEIKDKAHRIIWEKEEVIA